MKRWQSKLLEVLHQYPLDGYYLKETAPDLWKLYNNYDELIGTFQVNHRKNSPVPSLDSADLYKDRGKGLGRQVLSVLHKHYGKIRSDDKGQTSEAAEKMWKSLNARSVGNNEPGLGGSWYVLEGSQ